MISIENWVKKKFRLEAALSLLLALLCTASGLVILTITFFFTYAIIFACVNGGASGVSQLVANKPLHITHSQNLVASSIFVGLLFIGNARTSREYLSNYNLGHPAPPALIFATGITGSFASLLANPDPSAKMITEILYTGPRLIAGSFRAFLRFVQCLAGDTSGCAQALMFLLESARHVPYADLAGQLANHDVVRVFSQLRGIDGVLFLNSDPPTIALTDQLRRDLRTRCKL